MEFCVIIIELNVKGSVSQRDLHVLLAILRENLSGGGPQPDPVNGILC